MEFISPYQTTVLVLGLSALLFLIQLTIADVLSIRAKHTPGFAIEQDHGQLLFRTHRAFANSNETIGILLLLTSFGILSGASPDWLNAAAIIYFIGRVLHMVFYYLNLALMRSIAFSISYIGFVIMFVAGISGWLD